MGGMVLLPWIAATVCVNLAALLWFLVATRFGRKRITIRALFALILIESIVFWALTVGRHTVIPF
jgi:hypothetical protein